MQGLPIESDADSWRSNMRSTVFTAALVLRSLLALGAPKDQSGVSLIVRNDDGVDARTLSRVQRTG